MCSLPPIPTLPTISIDPCSLSTGGQTSCPIIFPDVAALPTWGVQLAFWALLYVPLTGMACILNGIASVVELDFIGFVSSLQAALLAFFTSLASLFAWAGPLAPVLGAAVLGAWVLIVVVVVLVLVNVGEDVAKVVVEA